MSLFYQLDEYSVVLYNTKMYLVPTYANLILRKHQLKGQIPSIILI